MKVWDRKNSEHIDEPILSEPVFRWLHETSLGLKVADRLLSQKWFSKCYGWPKDQSFSSRSIQDFAYKYNIDLDQYSGEKWSTFNEFFIRKFKPGVREFSKTYGDYCSPCEGRLLVAENQSAFPVKGVQLNLTELVQSSSLAKDFSEAFILVFRLSPFDYHRYHFVDEGEILESYDISGRLTSVHPLSLKHFPRTFLENQRRVSLVSTQNFGRILSVEVGALCVGRIQSRQAPYQFNRGEEQGYFLFGGSTLIHVLDKSKVIIDADILEKSQAGLECFVRLGERLGHSIPSEG